MALFDGIQSVLDKHVAPIAAKVNANQAIKALSTGMMSTMPITLGVALLAIIVNLPIEGLTAFLSSTGLADIANQVLAVTMNMLAVYLAASVAYHYGKARGLSGITSMIVTLGVFFVLLPLDIEATEYSVTYRINTAYMGSNGIFVAIILSLIIPVVLSFLMKHLSLKLPDSVPPMVTDSLSPTFSAIIMFTGACLIKWALGFTPWGNLFDLITTVIATPVMYVGSSPLAVIFVWTFASLLWFFGVHPSAVVNIYSPVITACILGNVEAFLNGQPLPYLTWNVVYLVTQLGGTAEGIGLALSSLTAKSERYKALSKISFIPDLFNISEPLMFGMPVVLNPTFFVPVVLSTPVCCGLAWLMAILGLGNGFNPTVSAPWVMPWPITGFLQGGLGCLVVVLVCIVAATLLYYPFFRTADHMALADEKGAEAKAAVNE